MTKKRFPFRCELYANDTEVTWYLLISCTKTLGWRNLTWRCLCSWGCGLDDRISQVGKNSSSLLWWHGEDIPDELLLPVHTRRSWKVKPTLPGSASDTANFRALHRHTPGYYFKSHSNEWWLDTAEHLPFLSCTQKMEWIPNSTPPHTHTCCSEIIHPKKDTCEVKGEEMSPTPTHHLWIKVQMADLFSLRKSQGSIIWKCAGYI